MNAHNMKTDVLLLSGNTDMQYDNRPWLYNDYNFKDYRPSGTPIADNITNPKIEQDEIAFEHFIPPTDNAVSSPSPTASQDLPLSHNGGNRSSSRIERSRKSRSSKQSPASEEDTPENKSRRRREQNRIAQRTFRERKDRYIQNLESHIKMLDASHKDLQESYRQSTDQISALYTQLIEAQGELDYWRYIAQPPPTTPAAAAGTSPSFATTSPTIVHPSTSGETMDQAESHNNNMHTASVPARHNISVMPGVHMPHGHFT